MRLVFDVVHASLEALRRNVSPGILEVLDGDALVFVVYEHTGRDIVVGWTGRAQRTVTAHLWTAYIYDS